MTPFLQYSRKRQIRPPSFCTGCLVDTAGVYFWIILYCIALLSSISEATYRAYMKAECDWLEFHGKRVTRQDNRCEAHCGRTFLLCTRASISAFKRVLASFLSQWETYTGKLIPFELNLPNDLATGSSTCQEPDEHTVRFYCSNYG
jgi:hypothetical protein